MFNWVSVELTNRCNKKCHFCNRNEDTEKGDMDIGLFENLLDDMSGLEIIQFHKDGEPLMYGQLSRVLNLCANKGIVTNIVTNGKLLLNRMKDLEDCTTITVSVFEKDEEQFKQVRRFIEITARPRMIIKLLGDYKGAEYEDLKLPIIRRQIHSAEGSFDYEKSAPEMPEIGVCLDIYKPSINWKGDMFICNRRDVDAKGKIGNLQDSSVAELWYGEKRTEWLEKHKEGNRVAVPACEVCEFWGIPKWQ